MEQNYVQEIKKALNNNLSQTIGESFIQNIQFIQEQLSFYLIALDEWNKRASQQIDVIQDDSVDIKYQRYRVAKRMLQEDFQIEDLLKQGYQIIDLMREFFTGETIKYQVGIEYYGKLYEGILSLEQIMSLAKVVPNWKGSVDNLIKLRLNTSKGNLARQLEQVSDDAEGHSSLWSAIRSYVGKKTNRGNVYEAYRVLVSRQGNNRIPPANWNEEEFDNVLNMVKKNTQSWTQGGDFLNEQFKFFEGNPSLTTLSTIRKTIKELQAIMQSFSGNDLIQGLNYYFQRDKATSQAVSLSKNFVQERIDQLLDSLKLK